MKPADHLRKFFKDNATITQTKFAKDIGCTQSQVAQWLSGHRPIPLSKAEAIETVYGLDGGKLCPLLGELRRKYGGKNINSIVRADHKPKPKAALP